MKPSLTSVLSPGSIHNEQAILVGGIAVALCARMVRTTVDGQHVEVAGRAMPVLCPIRRVTGRRCPGCGMTRAMTFITRGHLRKAISVNIFAVPVALVVLARMATAFARLRSFSRANKSTRVLLV